MVLACMVDELLGDWFGFSPQCLEGHCYSSEVTVDIFYTSTFPNISTKDDDLTYRLNKN